MTAPSPTLPPPSRQIAGLLARLGRFTIFIGQVVWVMPRRPLFLREILDATARVAARCVIPIVLVLGPIGMVVSLHGSHVFSMFGAERMLGLLVGIATLRELAPNLAAMVIAAQAGSACAAELAAMRVQEEIDATRIMGVDPIKYHVVPRVLGIVLAAPLLTVVGSASGIIGGFLLATFLRGHDRGAFLDNLFGALELFDLWSSLLKAAVFGALIGLTASYYGYTARGGGEGVGEAVNNTVVYSITLFLVLNYFLSTALFGIME